jgi:NADH:ubiquinone oxidoreductase subunit 2 (chain N)
MMSLFDMLALSVALFVFLNILARLANKKKLHFAITFFFLALILAILSLMLYYKDFGIHMGFINASQFSVLIAAILTMGMIVVQLIAYEEQVYTDFSLLSSFSYTGILLVVMSSNLVTIFIGLALLTVPTVFAMLLSRKWIEAGLKYFIVTALSASLFAFGAATLFFLQETCS